MLYSMHILWSINFQSVLQYLASHSVESVASSYYFLSEITDSSCPRVTYMNKSFLNALVPKVTSDQTRSYSFPGPISFKEENVRQGKELLNPKYLY